jgi:GNAT superfamily N-acetyltransferase
MRFTNRVIGFTEDGRTDVAVTRLELAVEDEVAFIEWESNGQLYYVKVPEKARRRGIATFLWNEANDYANHHNLPTLTHSVFRTTDGEAWAKSFGTQLPTRITT